MWERERILPCCRNVVVKRALVRPSLQEAWNKSYLEQQPVHNVPDRNMAQAAQESIV